MVRLSSDTIAYDRRRIIRLSIEEETIKGARCSADVCATLWSSHIHPQGRLCSSVIFNFEGILTLGI
jgi:hypothetical protein